MLPAKGRALAATGPLLLHRVAVSARVEGARLGAVVGMGRGGAATSTAWRPAVVGQASVGDDILRSIQGGGW